MSSESRDLIRSLRNMREWDIPGLHIAVNDDLETPMNPDTKPPAAPMTWPAAVCFLGVLVLLGWVAWLALT